MKVQCPYRCDYCLNLKGETNHWWLRPQDAEQFRLVRWDQQLADLEGYEHICSESCASKALSKWLAQASGNLVRPAAESPERSLVGDSVGLQVSQFFLGGRHRPVVPGRLVHRDLLEARRGFAVALAVFQILP